MAPRVGTAAEVEAAAADLAAARPAMVWWGKDKLGKDTYEAALDRVRETYKRFDHVFVSFSGGKDSTATLHVALDVAHELGQLPLRVVFFDEECISYETEDYVRRVAARPDVELEWWCLPVRHRNACSPEAPFWWPWAPEDRERWVRPLPTEALTELEGFPVEPPDARLTIPEAASELVSPFDRFGRSAMLMGIRAEESLIRHRAIGNKRSDNYVIPTQNPATYKVYPVYDWSQTDVWTAPAIHGWDYNATYDIMEMAGMPPFNQRCAPPFGEEPSQNLWHWAVCFPDLWERMCERVPGAAAAARYSRSELYSFNENMIQKPAGQTWQEFVRHLVEQQEPKVRGLIAARVRWLIRRHYRDTSEPLMPTARHPASGISWQRIAMVAQRGDLKARRTAMNYGGGLAAIPRMRAEYDAERAAVKRGELEL
jgi:predicted phosphoadenosine phosphosulfate sulfurtransferase